MPDDGFQLTPTDIRGQEFRHGVAGYKREEVDGFRERVAQALELLLREKAQLEERLNNFREQLKAFKEREKAMNEALLAAQQLKSQVQEATEKESELLLREARNEADGIVAQAREAEAAAGREVEAVQRQFSAYVAAFRRLLERHFAELDALVEHEVDGTPPDTTNST